MIELHEIKKFYPRELHIHERFLLKEYLQHKILELIFESDYAERLVFIGGSCLRLFHNHQRFSEDLDFDNFKLSVGEFDQLAEFVKQNLEILGYQVEIKQVIKGAYHCHIKFPKLLLKTGLSGYAEEKILIQLDTEDQDFDFTPEMRFLTKFNVFSSVFIAPDSLLLAQKFYAVLNRKRTSGRDFYDIVQLLSREVKPDYNFLDQKICVNNGSDLKEVLNIHCKQLEMTKLARELEPFLINRNDTKQLLHFEQFINQVKLD